MANSYASVEDVAERLGRILSDKEKSACKSLLEEAAVIINSSGSKATSEAKKAVSVRMVSRAIGSGADMGVPVGATQGSMSALGYSQSWTVGSGAVGELYLGRLDKQLLGLNNSIGSSSPVEGLTENGGLECAAYL